MIQNQNAPYGWNSQYQMQQQLYYQNKRKKEIHQLVTTGIAIGAAMIAYLVVQTLGVLWLRGSDYKELYSSSALFQNCFNIIVVHLLAMALPFGMMALVLRKRYDGPVVPLEKVGFVKGFAWVSLGMGICMLANSVTAAVVQLFKSGGYELSQPEMQKPDTLFTCIVVVVSTALVPAIIEEFAMRCCTLGVLKGYGKAFGVIAVSIVFGLLHGNAIQFVFAFLIGMVLGYITIVTDSVLPAMFIHGLNNGLSVTQQITEFAFDSDTATDVVGVIYFLWMALALWGLIYLAVKKQLLPKKQQKKAKEPYALSFGTKLLCLVPGLLIPFILLIISVLEYINPA